MNEKTDNRWSKSDIQSLIIVWSEFQPKLIAMGPKKVVWSEMENRLKELGSDKSGEQIKIKIKNLKADYRKYKPGSTGSSPSIWPYFDEVHAILKSSHFFNPDLASTRETESPISDCSSISSPSSGSSFDSMMKTTKGLKRKFQRIEDLKTEREEIKKSIDDIKELTNSTILKMNESNEELKNEMSEMRKDISNLFKYLIENKSK